MAKRKFKTKMIKKLYRDNTVPKKYTILNDPSGPIPLQDAYALVSEGNFSLRNNYAGCFFIENNSYLFFILKKDYEYTYE